MSQNHSVARRAGRAVAQVIAWVLIALGLTAWWLVFPETLGGWDSAGIIGQLATFWICVYGFVAGIGVVILLAVHQEKPKIARIALAVYAVLLVVLIVSTVVNAK